MTVISALLLRNGKDKEPAGIPLSLANKWKLFMAQCFDCHKCCRRVPMDWPTILEMAERAAGSWNQNSLLCEQGPECSHLPFLVSELNKPRQFRWRVLSQDLWQRNPHGSAYWVIFLTLVSPNLWKPFPTHVIPPPFWFFWVQLVKLMEAHQGVESAGRAVDFTERRSQNSAVLLRSAQNILHSASPSPLPSGGGASAFKLPIRHGQALPSPRGHGATRLRRDPAAGECPG